MQTKRAVVVHRGGGTPPGEAQSGYCPISPLNRPICARFGVVARWDFQERARLILPNEDGDCKRFLRNLAAHSWSPPDKCLGTVSGKSDSNEKRIRQYQSNRE